MSDAGQRILVVDDENPIRRYLRTALTAQGSAVNEAAIQNLLRLLSKSSSFWK